MENPIQSGLPPPNLQNIPSSNEEIMIDPPQVELPVTSDVIGKDAITQNFPGPKDKQVMDKTPFPLPSSPSDPVLKELLDLLMQDSEMLEALLTGLGLGDEEETPVDEKESQDTPVGEKKSSETPAKTATEEKKDSGTADKSVTDDKKDSGKNTSTTGKTDVTTNPRGTSHHFVLPGVTTSGLEKAQGTPVPVPQPGVSTGCGTTTTIKEYNPLGLVMQMNPWFAVSFMSVINRAMSLLLSVEKDTKFSEAQNAIQGIKLSFQMTLENAALIRASYDAQAQQKRMEALQNLTSGIINAVQLSATAYRAMKPKDHPEISRRNQDINEAKVKLDDAQKEFGKVAGPDKKAVTDAQIASKQKVERAEADLRAAKSSKHTKEMELYGERKQQYMLTANMIEGFSKSMIQSSQATLISAQGMIEAAKSTLEALIQMMNRYIENSRKYSDEANSNFAETIRQLKGIQDSTSAAFKIGTGTSA